MGKQRTKHSTEQRPRVSVDRAYTEFTTARQAQNVTPRTLDYYRDKLRPFIVWAQEHRAATVDQVTVATVRA